MKRERGPWYLITAVVLGFGIGVLWAWRIAPVRYVDTSPATMKQDFKDQYRALVAAAYVADGDIQRALARLDLLNDADVASAVTIQAQQALAAGRPEEEVHNLGLLAVALNQGANPVNLPMGRTPTPALTEPLTDTPELPTQTPSPAEPSETPQPTSTPVSATLTAQAALTASAAPQAALTATKANFTPTFTPLPSRTASPTPGAPYVVQGSPSLVCDPGLGLPLLMIQTNDKTGQPVSGVEIVVNWQGGEDHFFTGIKLEINPGYADYTMLPDVIYAVHAGEGGQPVTGLKAPECEKDSGERYWGSWKIVFVQP